jgi:menaquinone-dependent protoporphyrinogen oxidase
MSAVLIVYATQEGHTREIATRVAQAVRARGVAEELLDAEKGQKPANLSAFSAAILAASVHQGNHEPAMAVFVKRHRQQLARMPSAFLSVSLTQADAENAAAPEEKRAEAVRTVDAAIARFVAETGWLPDHVQPLAGALPYTRYNALLRWVMTRIARQSGHPTDTSRDHVFTDWTALDRFVDNFVLALQRDRMPASV